MALILAAAAVSCQLGLWGFSLLFNAAAGF